MLGLRKLEAQKQYFFPFRKTGNKRAVVLVHGLGEKVETWADFAKLLMDDRALNDWDVYSLGYLSKLRIELFSKASSLANQAEYLYANLILPPVGKYESIAIVAHSVGGLLVQQVLVDFPEVLARTTHLFLLGTPSEGSREAHSWRFLNQQMVDIDHNSRFIRALRRRWKQRFGDGDYPFRLEVIASADDERVRLASVRKPFPGVNFTIVEGNHAAMIKPKSVEAKSFQTVRNGLLSEAPRTQETALAALGEPPRSFISYSHKDSDWLMSIESVLFPLLGRDAIGRIWDDRRIESGDLWDREIKVAMERAKVAILLVSPSFVLSKYISANELPFLMERAKDERLRLLLIYIRINPDESERLEFEQENCKKIIDELNQFQAIEHKTVLVEVPKERIGKELRVIAEEIKNQLQRHLPRLEL